MPTIHRSIRIHAPITRVFDYVADPTHLPEIWPSLVDVRNVVPHTEGNSFDWVYKLLGMRIRGHSEPVELVINERQVTRSERGIPNTFRWSYATRANDTEVTLDVDYTVPVPGRMAERIVTRINERDAETLLANLKHKMEAA